MEALTLADFRCMVAEFCSKLSQKNIKHNVTNRRIVEQNVMQFNAWLEEAL